MKLPCKRLGRALTFRNPDPELEQGDQMEWMKNAQKALNKIVQIGPFFLFLAHSCHPDKSNQIELMRKIAKNANLIRKMAQNAQSILVTLRLLRRDFDVIRKKNRKICFARLLAAVLAWLLHLVLS